MVQKTAFRLFEVEVFEGLKRKPVPDGENIGDTELIEYIESALQDMQGNPMIGKPTSLPHPEDLVKQQPKADDPYLTVLEHSRRGRVIEVGVSTGRYGDRDSLMNPKGVVNDISDSATGRNYRVRLAFPEDKNKFYIVSQVRGRSEAGVNLLKFLSFFRHLQVCVVNNGTVDTNGKWYRFLPRPIIDNERFDTLANNVTMQRLSLKSSGTTHGPRINNSITVTTIIQQDKLRAKALTLLQKWVNALLHKHDLNKRSSAQEVAAIFPEGYLHDTVDWDDGQLTFEENGSQTTVSAQTIGDLFTYPLPPGSNINDLWVDADKRLRIISQMSHVNIPHIDTL